MRKLRKLRRVYLPHILALVLVFVVFTMGAAQESTSGGDVDIIAFLTQQDYELPEKDGRSAEAPQQIAFAKSLPAAEVEWLTGSSADSTAKESRSIISRIMPEKTKYNSSVNAALARMALTPDAINKWIAQHPKSALKEVETMTPAMQKRVADIATFIRSVNGQVDKKTAWREAAAIVHYCSQYNISTELAVGVAKAESNFTPTLTSKAGARGVMQVMWKYHAGMLQAKGIAAIQDDLWDPERGVEAGVLLLSRYLEAYGTIPHALSRYFGKASTSYVKKVDSNIAMLEKHVDKNGL